MDLENILDVMSAYDFRAPLKTVIIMEDNEDTDDEKETKDTEVQNIDQLNVEVINAKRSEGETNLIDPEIVPSNECISECPNAQTHNKRKKSKTESVTPKLKQILSKRRPSNNETRYFVNDGGPSPYKRTSNEKQNDESYKRKCSDVATDNNKQNDYNRKSEFYIKSTLRIVSENLLHIIASKAQVMKSFYDKNSERYGRQDLVDKQVLALKYSFFKMTYSVTVTILLPLENNKMFIKTLLLSTLSFGNTNGISSSFEELEKIYSDMLLWTKEYRYRFIPSLIAHEAYTAYSATRTPPTNPETSTHPPMRNGFLKPVQSDMPHLSAPQKNHPTHEPPAYFVATNNQNCYGMSTSSNDRNLVSDYQNTNAPSVLSTNSSPVSSLPKAYKKQTRENVLPPQFKTSNDNSQSVLQINYRANTIFSKSITPNSEVEAQRRFQAHMPPLPCSNKYLNYSVQAPSSWDMRAPNVTITNIEPSQTSNQHVQQYETRSSIPNVTITNIEPSQTSNQHVQQYEIRSSVSRDSGFMSPVDSANEMHLTPFITEVTSLNPNVKHVNVGTCIVCQKSTRKVCLGCYKEHYCSFECMLANWPNHRLRCTDSENQSSG